MTTNALTHRAMVSEKGAMGEASGMFWMRDGKLQVGGWAFSFQLYMGLRLALEKRRPHGANEGAVLNPQLTSRLLALVVWLRLEDFSACAM